MTDDQQFKDIGPCPIRNEIEIERDVKTQLGKLWLGGGWLTVAEARAVRDWLNEMLP